MFEVRGPSPARRHPTADSFRAERVATGFASSGRRVATRGENRRASPSDGMDRPSLERCVLVVEDDPTTRSFLIENLIADGFRAVGAAGAGEGLRALEVRQ